MSEPSPHAELVLGQALERTPTLGVGRLICVDGPAGSGKTTLAAELAELSGALVLHMDDMFEGWEGLPRVTEQLESVLLPLAEGHSGSYRRWNWPDNDWAETVLVPPVPLLVIEGVGSGSSRIASLITLLAWVEVPFELRMERGLERDGHGVAEHWRQWALDEQALFDRERTRERADLHLDGRTGSRTARR